MFIWDFVADTVLGQIVDWIYGQMILAHGADGGRAVRTGLDPGDCPVFFTACLGALCGGTCGGGI